MARSTPAPAPLLDDLKGFALHGERWRINMISFRREDAEYIVREAERRDCTPGDVIRDIVREHRRAKQGQP